MFEQIIVNILTRLGYTLQGSEGYVLEATAQTVDLGGGERFFVTVCRGSDVFAEKVIGSVKKVIAYAQEKSATMPGATVVLIDRCGGWCAEYATPAGWCASYLPPVKTVPATVQANATL